MNAASQGGGDQEEGSSSSSRWGRTVEKIKNDAQVKKRIPAYYKIRFDAIGNSEYPSIFKLDSRQPISHTGVTALSYPASQLAPPVTQQAALVHHTAPAKPIDHTGMATIQAPTATTDRQIVVAAVGPYHLSAPAKTSPTQPLITRETKCGIVMFLAQERFSLSITEFLDWAWENVKRARRCYEHNSLQPKRKEFSEMLLLDGCLLLFAIFVLRSSVSEDGLPATLARHPDCWKEFRSLSADITLHTEQTRLDLLVLDNQIPFFVVAELHKRLKGTLFEGVNHTIKQMALSCFDEVHPMGRRGTADDMPDPVRHLLHLFHWSRVPSGKYNVDHSSLLLNEPRLHLPSATDLRESATLFRKKTSGHPLDLSFHSRTCGYGVMKIPTLYLYDYSEQIFRNLIGFEQRHLRCGLGVTAYSTSMARLLQSEADAKLLRNEKILAHTPKTDKEIVDFFRRLGDEYKYTLKTNDLLKFYNDVRRHHKSGVRRMIGGIMLQYFPTRLITIVVICGLIFSLASVFNNIHNVIRYYHPRKQ